MKVWQEFGSEHSMRLVLIGRFKQISQATKVHDEIEKLIGVASSEYDAGQISVGGNTDRFSDKMQEILRELHFHDITPTECEQLLSDVRITRENDRIVLTTDESEISAFLKFLLHNEARIEVFSGHHYPEEAAKARE